jgi:hypothetical protein
MHKVPLSDSDAEEKRALIDGVRDDDKRAKY